MFGLIRILNHVGILLLICSTLSCSNRQRELEQATLEELTALFESHAKTWAAHPELLGFSDVPVKSTSRELSDREIDNIARDVIFGLKHDNTGVRKAAAAALAPAPRRTQRVDEAILVGLNHEDSEVVSYTGQAANRIPPEFSKISNRVPQLLKSEHRSKRWVGIELIRVAGESARPYGLQLVSALFEAPSDRESMAFALTRISIDRETAKVLWANIDILKEIPHTGIAALFLEHPDYFKRYIAQHPKALPYDADLYDCLCKYGRDCEIAKFLATQESVSPVVMATLGHPKFIPKLDQALNKANTYEQHLLLACRIACGAKPHKTVQMSAQDPAPFRPTSAWPGVDKSRIDPERSGHGDGDTTVLITGAIKTNRGKVPTGVRFTEINNRMLLGTETSDESPILIDRKTGEFVYLTGVFAAYAFGGESEPGPYQTGSSQVRIEADGCQPLEVQFFDEMPHTLIELQSE